MKLKNSLKHKDWLLYKIKEKKTLKVMILNKKTMKLLFQMKLFININKEYQAQQK